MYDNLKSLGITNPEEIDRYSLRQEANNDILKIYFQKDRGEFFAKSVKFKYPRQRKTVVADGIGQGYKEVQEISPNLRYVIDELDQICQRDRSELDLKRKILDDLRHLESVVANKISEIEADLDKLTRNKKAAGASFRAPITLLLPLIRLTATAIFHHYASQRLYTYHFVILLYLLIKIKSYVHPPYLWRLYDSGNHANMLFAACGPRTG